MAEDLLTATDLELVERLLSTTVDNGCDLLPDDVLRTLTELFPRSVAGVSELDASDAILRARTFPAEPDEFCSESLQVTAFHDAAVRRLVRIFLRRSHPPFTPRDRFLFRLLAPKLESLTTGPDRRRQVQELSPSEMRVLALVAQGASNCEVSESLSVSVGTVRKHLEHIYLKLGVRNRTAAVVTVFPNSITT